MRNIEKPGGGSVKKVEASDGERGGEVLEKTAQKEVLPGLQYIIMGKKR